MHSHPANIAAPDRVICPVQREVYAGSERLEQFTDRGNGGYERLLYVHEDLQGNTRYYTKENGNSFAELTYDAWGMPVSPNKLLNNDHGNYVYATYTGHIFDTTLDIYFCEARFYDANTRQWMAMDPIKDGGNWYQYCYSNPLTYWDSTGTSGFSRYGCYKDIIIDIVNELKEMTQTGELDPLIALFIDAKPDENGIYHIGQDYWQSSEWIGYNSIYDAVFDLATSYTGTSMERDRFFFTANEKEYVFWMWKDYINLGAGAEVGIYKKSPVPGHWLTAPEESLAMTLKLTNNKTGKVYYDYSPEEKNWWITGFDPSHLNNKEDDLTVTVTIDFAEKKNLWEGFQGEQPFAKGWEKVGEMKASYTW